MAGLLSSGCCCDRPKMRNSLTDLEGVRDRKLEDTKMVIVSYSVFKVNDVMREIQS